MPEETLTSLEFVVAEDRQEQPISGENLFNSEEGLTTKEAENLAGTLVMKMYEELGAETTQKILGNNEQERLPILGVHYKGGMILVPETGIIIIPGKTEDSELKNVLRTPVSETLKTDKDSWVFMRMQKPEFESTDKYGVDTEDGDENLSVRKINEKAPIPKTEVAKRRTQVMRRLSGASPKSETVTSLELTKDNQKITVMVEKNEKGKTVLIGKDGEKFNLADYPDDVNSLYEQWFKGPASGEEPIGIETAFPSDRHHKLPEKLDAEVGDFPEIEKQINVNAKERTYSLYMNLVGPTKAINNLLETEHKKLTFTVENPLKLPEEYVKTGIKPAVISMGGDICVFYDEKKQDYILCKRDENKEWGAARIDGMAPEQIESLWIEEKPLNKTPS